MFNRKTRRKEESVSTINKDEVTNVNENSSEMKSSSSSPMNTIKSNVIPYLESQFVVFTRTFAQCNINELIKLPEGVEQNEWIAINCLYIFIYFNIKLIFLLKLFHFSII